MTPWTTAAMAALGLGLGLGMGGCKEIATGPSQGEATMQVGVRGDADGSSSASRSPDGARFSYSSASGTVEIEARVWVQTRAGQWVEATEGVARQTVQASGSDGVRLLATSEVEAGSYRRVRMEFHRVEADVRGGITIGTSLLTGSVRVEGGSDSRIVVEREVAFTAEAGGSKRLEIDLNADQWLSRADTQSRTVAEAEFRSAVQVVAR